MNVWTAFLRSARGRAASPSVVSPHGTLTFHQLRDAAEACAARLEARGLRAGDLAVVSTPNDPLFAVAVLAIARVGATIALVPPKFGRAEWEAVRAAARPRFVVTTEPAGLLWGDKALRWEPIDAWGGRKLILGSPADAMASRDRAASGTAVVKFTSGSTGTPKGIGLTAENLAAEAGNVIRTLDLQPGARIVVPVPLTHSYGFDLGFLPMVYGGTTLDLHEHFSPPRILERLAQSDADVFLGAPSMYHFLAEAAPSPAPSFSRVRYLLSCTAPLSEGLITRFHEIFGAVICQHYGSSETGAVANHVPSQVLVRPGSVGRAMAGVEVEIRSDDGGAVAHGEEGEVFVRSAALASGYFALVPECATPFRDGGFYTGDLGRLDPQGFLEVTGRRDDMINVAGFKVSPLEVKRVLESYAPVREAAVFGVADPAAGEVVHAMVSLKALATEAGIIAHCRMLLSDHKVPRHVDIVADLPRGATGKVKLPGKGARS